MALSKTGKNSNLHQEQDISKKHPHSSKEKDYYLCNCN